MKQKFLLFIFGFLLALRPALGSEARDEQITRLREAISNHIHQAQFRPALWGLKIVSLEQGAVWFEHNADKLLKPASNAKLYSGALALEQLGPDFRFKTSIYARHRPNKKGVLKSDLVIYGRGDPSQAARFHDGVYLKDLEALADKVAAAGIKKIKGSLVADESYFRGPPMGAGWTWDDLQYYYGAEVSALTLEDNVVDLMIYPGPVTNDPCRIVTKPPTDFLRFENRAITVETNGRPRLTVTRPIGENVVYVTGALPLKHTGWSDAVAVRNPAEWYARTFRSLLEKRGIELAGKIKTVSGQSILPEESPYHEWIELAAHESPPLSEILPKMMKPSQNLYAHLLLLQAGAHSKHGRLGGKTSETIGLAALEDFLRSKEIDPAEVLLEEGSGLSRAALVTPNATVKLLVEMDRSPHRAVFQESLPVAGRDGTLRARMRSTAAEGNVRAKTGTLRYVYALSGYVTTQADDRLVFSIMLNNHKGDSATTARNQVDKIAVMLAEFPNFK